MAGRDWPAARGIVILYIPCYLAVAILPPLPKNGAALIIANCRARLQLGTLCDGVNCVITKTHFSPWLQRVLFHVRRTRGTDADASTRVRIHQLRQDLFRSFGRIVLTHILIGRVALQCINLHDPAVHLFPLWRA